MPMLRPFSLALLGVLGFILLGAHCAHATCVQDDPTGVKRAAARADVSANCGCGSLPHLDYVKCSTVRLKVNPTGLPQSCKSSVQHCATNSNCGRAGIACCRQGLTDNIRCSIKKDVAHCLPPKGGQSCAGAFASCCDSCDANLQPPCAVPPPTPTPPPCHADFQMRTCGGTCPAGFDCGLVSGPPQLPGCGCVPSGTTPCGDTTFATCGGSCPDGEVCYPFDYVNIDSCGCAPVGAACGNDTQCSGGLACPTGSVCSVSFDQTCTCVTGP